MASEQTLKTFHWHKWHSYDIPSVSKEDDINQLEWNKI